MAAEYFDALARTRQETGFIQTLVRALGSIDRASAPDAVGQKIRTSGWLAALARANFLVTAGCARSAVGQNSPYTRGVSYVRT